MKPNIRIPTVVILGLLVCSSGLFAAADEIGNGKIRAVDAKKGSVTIRLTTTDSDLSLGVDAKSTFFVNGKSAKLGDLEVGQKATVFYKAGTKTIARLRAFDDPAAKDASKKYVAKKPTAGDLSKSGAMDNKGSGEKKASGKTVNANHDPGLNARYRLETKPVAQVHAVLTYELKMPGVNATDWVACAPVLPDLPYQRKVQTTMSPAAKQVREKSPLKRLVLQAKIPVKTPSERTSVPIKIEFDATLYSRALMEVDSSEKRSDDNANIADLTDHERSLATARTIRIDTKSAALASWMDKNDLAKKPGEGEIDHARRVYVSIVRNYQYEYNSQMDWRIEPICSKAKSDCGGLSMAFVAALRREGTPARLIVGRWAKSANFKEMVGDVPYYQSHVKAEFFAVGVGWIPVDCASGVLYDKKNDGANFFGVDRGNFIVFHIDPELDVDSIFFGRQAVIWLNGGPAVWVVGGGTPDSPSVVEDWKVEKRDP